MRVRAFVGLAISALLLGPVQVAEAGHISFLGAVDAIDIVFPAGGGVHAGSASGVTDDAWLVFEATAGDIVTFVLASSGWHDAVILRDTTDGIVDIGDAANILGFNDTDTVLGEGVRLVAQHGPWSQGECAVSYCFGATESPRTLTFPVSISGQYVLGITVSNEGATDPMSLNFDATLSGNTSPASGAAPVPEPASLLLIGSGLAAIRLRRSRTNQA